jgi:hypothetical protein
MESTKNNERHISFSPIGLLIVIAIQIVGFALLWNEITSQQQYIYLPTENSRGTTAGAQTNPVVAVTKFPTESVLRETIQSVLKQELTPYARQLAAAPQAQQNPPPIDPPGVKENSTENIQAFNDSLNIVDSAIARGKWIRDDTAAILPYSQRLTHSQRKQIMEKMGQAINGQELKLEDMPPGL